MTVQQTPKPVHRTRRTDYDFDYLDVSGSLTLSHPGLFQSLNDGRIRKDTTKRQLDIVVSLLLLLTRQ
ncbi:MAG: hypothetical protein ABW068_14600 [Candidatus Thiodiazotropha sp.]